MFGASFIEKMELNELLLNWYDQNARALPWRGTKDVYQIWLSEIMLQQTQAATVRGYYARFLEEFPNVFALAAADEDAVLKLWEGLGYYSRARNLHAAARRVAEAGGHFPDNVEGLQTLPGVGPYAARAIASIAYDIPCCALDGNQMRVLSRAFAVERVLATPFDLADIAESALSRARPGDYNQSLMDLGSAVCTPKKPKCELCPLAPLCRAHQAGDAERYPLRPAPTPKRDVDKTILLVRCGGRIAVQKRPAKGLLGGLYEFPNLDMHCAPDAALSALNEMGFSGARDLEPLPPARHVFTHLIWRMKGYLLEADAAPDGVLWADEASLAQYAFPSALRKYRKIAQEILRAE